jgi:hypothetical protein
MAAMAQLRTLGLEGASWHESMASAGPYVDSNWTQTSGFKGAGVRVGVIEYYNVHGTGDLSGKVATPVYSATGPASDGFAHRSGNDSRYARTSAGVGIREGRTTAAAASASSRAIVASSRLRSRSFACRW